MKTKSPAKSSRSRKVLNAPNLEALGADQLAAILLDLSEDQPGLKRRLRIELAAAVGAGDLVLELEKRFEAIEAARGRVHWRKLKDFRRELDHLRRTIAGPLRAADPALALRQGLRLFSLEAGISDRVNDAKGDVAEVFDQALRDLADVAPILPPDAEIVAEEVFGLLRTVRPFAMGPLVQALTPALEPAEVARLRGLIEMEMAPQRRLNAGWRAALHPLLDAQGDAAAFAQSFTTSEAVLPPIGARIAERLIRAGDLEGAAAALDRANPHASATSRGGKLSGAAPNDPGVQAWERVRIDLLEASGQGEAAQAARWEIFEQTLSIETLKAYLSRLADFDDVVAVDRAVEHALTHRPITAALRFLVEWSALEAASRLVLTRAGEIDGMAVEVLELAARRLETRFPLAASLVLRAMVQDVARFAQTGLYDRAQVWLMEAASLSVQISDLGEHESHEAFAARIAGYRRW